MLEKVLKLRAYSRCISLPLKIVESLDLDENNVVLYRIVGHDKLCIGKVIKVTRKQNNQNIYKLSIRKDTLEKLNLKFPSTIEIEFLEIKKLGYKPQIKHENKKFIDLVSLIYNDVRFTCFESDNNKILVYYQNNKSRPIILQRFIKLNELSLWNAGFYIAEGLKKNCHRVSACNNKSELIRRFLSYLKMWGISEDMINLDIRIKPEFYSKDVKRYWLKEIGAPDIQINVRKHYNRPTNSEYGNAEIIIYNTPFAIIHQNFISHIINSGIITSRDDALPIICGIEDGDGYVMKHNGSIEIGVTLEKEFTNFITNLYTLLYQKPRIVRHWTSDKVDRIHFRGKKIALKFLLDEHFKEHPDKWNRLIELLKLFMSRDLKYLTALKSKPLNKSSLSVLANVSHPAARQIIKKYLINGLVTGKFGEIELKGRKYYTEIFYLNDFGNKVVKYFNL